MAHFEVREEGHFQVRGKLPPCAIHGMVDQRCKTARDQRRFQARMLDNIIQAHAYLISDMHEACQNTVYV